jgi:hypothetical protein
MADLSEFQARWLNEGRPKVVDAGTMSDGEKLQAGKTPCVACGAFLASDRLREDPKEKLCNPCTRNLPLSRLNGRALSYKKERW